MSKYGGELLRGLGGRWGAGELRSFLFVVALLGAGVGLTACGSGGSSSSTPIPVWDQTEVTVYDDTDYALSLDDYDGFEGSFDATYPISGTAQPRSQDVAHPLLVSWNPDGTRAAAALFFELDDASQTAFSVAFSNAGGDDDVWLHLDGNGKEVTSIEIGGGKYRLSVEDYSDCEYRTPCHFKLNLQQIGG